MSQPRSYILMLVAKVQFFVLNLFALYLLLRGHHLPGGGFIAGLVAASSILLLSLAVGWEEIHRVLRIDPAGLAILGLVVASLAGLLGWLGGRPFLEHFTVHLEFPLLGAVHVGTHLLFDMGVVLVVCGMTCKVLFVMGKSTERLRHLVELDLRRYAAPVEEPIEAEPPPNPALSPEETNSGRFEEGRDHATG
ncbi:MAG: MnhB domain-containing protein [Verrucomicrobiota bacterium]|nr:hypothetical protein [Limisphaera sp.]MDW8382150.1 MnhB domain-containing protein [Verrucomicrobiota bacterium]